MNLQCVHLFYEIVFFKAMDDGKGWAHYDKNGNFEELKPNQSRQSYGVVGGCQSLTHPQIQQIEKQGNKWIKT